MRTLIFCAIAAVIFMSVPTTSTPVHASEPRTCLVFEDDSFICGVIEQSHDGNTWFVDRTHRYVTGCIPDGLCDTAFTDDCDNDTEDVACYDEYINRQTGVYVETQTQSQSMHNDSGYPATFVHRL